MSAFDSRLSEYEHRELLGAGVGTNGRVLWLVQSRKTYIILARSAPEQLPTKRVQRFNAANTSFVTQYGSVYAVSAYVPFSGVAITSRSASVVQESRSHVLCPQFIPANLPLVTSTMMHACVVARVHSSLSERCVPNCPERREICA